MPLQPKLARNSDTQTLCSTPKRCNSNDAISTFEIHVGELRVTFLRNHNMRRHKDPSRRQPKQKTTQAQQTEDPQAEDTPSPEDNPSGRQLKHRRPPQPRQPPQPPQARGRCARYVALHPLCGGVPVMWRCTRTEEVHCLRIGCSAPTYKNKRGTGPPNHSPPHPSMRSWALLVAGRPRRPRHHLHPGPLRHLPHPYMRGAPKTLTFPHQHAEKSPLEQHVVSYNPTAPPRRGRVGAAVQHSGQRQSAETLTGR